MCEVDRLYFIAGMVVVGVQAEAGNGVSNNSLPSERVIIRTLKKVFFRMWVLNKPGSSFREFGPEIGAFVARQPQLFRSDFRIRAADHLEFEVRDQLFL